MESNRNDSDKDLFNQEDDTSAKEGPNDAVDDGPISTRRIEY